MIYGIEEIYIKNCFTFLINTIMINYYTLNTYKIKVI